MAQPALRLDDVHAAPSELEGAAARGACAALDKWARRWAISGPSFLLFASLFCFVQSGIISGVIPSTLATIETRYGMTSVQSASLFTVYDVVVTAVVIPVSVYGRRLHSPRVLSAAFALFTFGALLFVSPQWLLGRYEGAAAARPTDLCTAGGAGAAAGAVSDCTKPFVRSAYVLLMCGMIVMGLGSSPLVRAK